MSRVLGKQARRKSLAILLGLAMAAGLATLVEAFSRHQLRRASERVWPLLLNLRDTEERLPSSQQVWGPSLVVSDLDPHIGFAHDRSKSSLFGEIPGFAVYHSKGADDENPLRIIALGGSTTDPLTAWYLREPEADPEDPHNWPRALAHLLEADGISARVYNGGVAGFSASQELLKLIRDVPPLEPDIVLHMNGVNEPFHRLKETPMTHPYQRQIFQAMLARGAPALFPNTIAYWEFLRNPRDWKVTGIHYGLPSGNSPHAQWLQDLRCSHALSVEFGFDMVAYLQPALGIGKYSPNEREREFLRMKGGQYLQTLQEFYQEAIASCVSTPYCTDLTDALDGQENAYLDARHQTRAGVQALAEAVYQDLRQRGYISGGAITRGRPG